MTVHPTGRAVLAIVFGLGAAMTAAAQTTPVPALAASASPAQPAGAACPAGGRFTTDPFAPKPAFPEQTRAPRPSASTGYRIDRVVGPVARGRTMAPLPDGRLLVAELGGRIRLVGADGAAGEPIAGGPVIPEPSTMVGIQDLVLDPAFARNRVIYLSYGSLKPGQPPRAAAFGAPPEAVGHVLKAKLSAAGDRFEDVVELYQGPPVRRLAAARDGTLYVSTMSGAAKSQAMDDDSGKVLRMRTDGSAPPDNPFARRADAGRFVYALGFRDDDGMALDAAGRVWAIEHGPRGGDELNQIRSGRNYGFPVIDYGRQYSGAELNGGLTAKEGLEQPVYYWTPDVAPSGMMIYSGKMFPQWKGNIFVGGLVAQSLIRLTLKGDKVASEEFMLADQCTRIRDVREAADGSIYVLTDEPAGKVLRLTKK